MTQVFENPADSPPQVSGSDTIAASAPGLISGSGTLDLTLTASPGSVSADVRVWVYGTGTLPGPTSPLGAPPPPAGPPAQNSVQSGGPYIHDPGPPPRDLWPTVPPPVALGWWLIQESTLSVGVPVAIAVPVGAVPLVVTPGAGVSMLPAGRTGVPVPGYPSSDGRLYTAAGAPRIAFWPEPAPTPFAAFVALLSPVAGDYAFSVSP